MNEIKNGHWKTTIGKCLLLLVIPLLLSCRETVRSADDHYARGEFASAAEEYRRFIRENPRAGSLPNAWLGLAWSEYQRKEFTKAGEAIEILRSRFPDHYLIPSARYLLSMSLYSQRRFVEASNELRGLIADHPADPVIPDARLLLARSEGAMLRHTAAAEQYRIYLEQYGDGPYVPAALLGRAGALGKAALWAEAASTLEEYLARYPNHPDRPKALLDVAQYRMAYGEYAAAEPRLLELSRIGADPELQRIALKRLAELYESTRREPQAMEAWKSYYDALPGESDTEVFPLLVKFARWHAARGEGDIARRYYLRVARDFEGESREHAEALEWLATFDIAEGRREDGIRHAERYLDLHYARPEAMRVERMVIDQLVAAGRFRDGRDRLTTLVKRQWSSATSADFYRLASLSLELKDYPEALAASNEGLQRARRADDTRALLSGLYHTMIIHNLSGRPDRAVEHWWTLKDLSPFYVTPAEAVFWNTVEERFYRDNMIPPERRGLAAFRPSRVLAVHIAGFDWAGGDSLAAELSRSLSTLLTSSVSERRDMSFAPRDQVKLADQIRASADLSRPPDAWFPLRSTINADWVIHGHFRREADRIVLSIRLVRVDFNGLFPFEYEYRLIPHDARAGILPIVRETIDRLAMYHG
jgi:TolA-binding protein/TolB-like protein